MQSRLEAALQSRLAGLGLTARELLRRDAPGGLTVPGLVSANGQCRLLQTADGWVALNLARRDDMELVLALTGAGDDVWSAVSRFAAQTSSHDFRQWATELHLPVAVVGEAGPFNLACSAPVRQIGRVLDMSALWAGPLCAGLLARAGAEVVRIENLGRPDPTPIGSPALDARINGNKYRLPLDLRTPVGRSGLAAELDRCDVVVTSARPAALARLGIDRDTLRHATWVAITAHGMEGAGGLRVGFGDDCAVAGGLVEWRDGTPHFLGDALADPLTGVEAALAVLSGQRGVIDMGMARIASGYRLDLQ